MKRPGWILGGLGVVIAGLVIAILLSIRGGEEGSPSANPTATAPPTPAGSEPEERTLVPSALPRRDAEAASGGTAAEEGRDAPSVPGWRDHRGGPDDERPEPAITRETLTSIRPDLHAIVKECAEPMKSQDPSRKGRLVVTMHLKVVGGAIQVPNIMFRQDMLGHDKVQNDALVACVRQGFEKASLAAPAGQVDGEQDVSMAFPIP